MLGFHPLSSEPLSSLAIQAQIAALLDTACSPGALLPIEIRISLPFTTPELDNLRLGVIRFISTDTMVDHRIRALLLVGHQNDFRAVMADVLRVPAPILVEPICGRRGVFVMDRELSLLDATSHQARQELRGLNLSQGYLELLEARALGPSPQHRISAACATVLIAAALLLEDRK